MAAITRSTWAAESEWCAGSICDGTQEYFRYAFRNEEEHYNGGTMEYFRYVGRGGQGMFPPQNARTVGASNKSRSRALEARHNAYNCLNTRYHSSSPPGSSSSGPLAISMSDSFSSSSA